MRHWILFLAAAAAGGLLPTPAEAFCGCPPVLVPVYCFEYRTVTCYRTEYRTEFKEVQRTVVRSVPETVWKEVEGKVMVPHWREVTRQRTVMVPYTRYENRQREVCRTEWVKQERERTVMVPETPGREAVPHAGARAARGGEAADRARARCPR